MDLTLIYKEHYNLFGKNLISSIILRIEAFFNENHKILIRFSTIK